MYINMKGNEWYVNETDRNDSKWKKKVYRQFVHIVSKILLEKKTGN